MTSAIFYSILLPYWGEHMEENNLSIHWCMNHEYVKLNHYYYMDEEINHTFGGERKDRMLNASAASIIKLGNNEIGFLLLVEETNNQYNIDMGILKKYRGKGYSTMALKLFKEQLEQYELDYLISTHINNKPANSILIANSFEIVKTENSFRYYTLKREKSSI